MKVFTWTLDSAVPLSAVPLELQNPPISFKTVFLLFCAAAAAAAAHDDGVMALANIY